MSVITVSNLTFGYDSRENIFENLSFQIDTSWRLGFIGINGKGKTTLLKLLMGEYEYSGRISAGVQFEYFPYKVRNNELPAREVLREIAGEAEDWRLERELNMLEMDLSFLTREFKTLSGGEQAKALLAAMFIRPNGFLLIDEPTNHLDGRGRERVAEYLKSKEGFILVSHDRAFLDGCVDHILSLNRTGMTIQKGNFTSWEQNKRKQDAFEQAENMRLKKDIERLKEASRQAGQWASQAESMKIGGKAQRSETKSIGGRAYIGERARRLQQKRKNIQKRADNAIEEKRGLLKDVEEIQELRINCAGFHSGLLAEGVDLSLFYGERRICGPLSFKIMQGEIIALEGQNGSGKSSLLKLICGEDISYTGRFYRAAGLKISYVPQDVSFLRGSLTQYAHSCGVDITLFKALLRKLDFSREQFEKDMRSYSEGQKKKVLLARSLAEQAHIYIWDEPLNYIDVFSRMQIEEMLIGCGGTLIVVEHDRAFLEKTASRRLALD